MFDCYGRPLDEDIRDQITFPIRRQMRTKCCWCYLVNWNGRYVNDVTCSILNDISCEVNIRIVRFTIQKRCMVQGLKLALIELKKPGANLSSIINF
jgi:hypothetical protein